MNFTMHSGTARARHQRTARGTALVLVALGGAVAGAAPMVFPQGAHQAYAVTTDNRLYTYDLNTHALAFKHSIAGLQPGESIRGIDFKHVAGDPSPSTDLFLLGSSGRVYLLDYDAGTQTYSTQPFDFLFGFAVTGNSIGFDVRYQPWPPFTPQPLEKAFIYASRGSDGALTARTPVQSSGGSMAHYADGSPAYIGGLASFDDSGSPAPPWGLIGIDTARQQFVSVDPHHPPNGFGGPTLGLCTPKTTFFGPSGAMDLADMAGFDLQEWFEQSGPGGGVYGVMALNEAGSSYTSLYAMREGFAGWFAAPIGFERIGELVLNDPGPIRFSAVAMIPTPGTAALFGTGLFFGVRRRRWVN